MGFLEGWGREGEEKGSRLFTNGGFFFYENSVEVEVEAVGL